jgi:archaellum component FlaC
MSISPTIPPKEPESGGGTPLWLIILVVVIAVLVAYSIYAQTSAKQSMQADVKQATQKLDVIAKRMDVADDRFANLKGQVEVTTERLGLTQKELERARSLAQAIKKEVAASNEQLAGRITEVQKASEAGLASVTGEVTGVKTDVAGTKQEVSEIKMRLDRAIGDLGVQSGLIAKNRDELDELRRRGERNYYDFDLTKRAGPQRVGPVTVRLKKADAKKLRYTMDVVVDDRNIEKKDKTLLEPVQFLVKGTRIPYEVVVQDVQKDRIVGYLSTPKEIAAAPQP